MYADNELLFPPYVIPTLKSARGDSWRKLIERVADLPEDHRESLAFSLMMVRLNGCLACETDSYRAMRGCGMCTQQTLRRYKGADRELLDRYEKALVEFEKLERLPVIPIPDYEREPSARAA